MESELERLRTENQLLLSLYSARCSGDCGGATPERQLETVNLHRLLGMAYDAIPRTNSAARDNITREYEQLAMQCQIERRTGIHRMRPHATNPSWNVYQQGLFAPLLARSTHRAHQQQQQQLQQQLIEQQQRFTMAQRQQYSQILAEMEQEQARRQQQSQRIVINNMPHQSGRRAPLVQPPARVATLIIVEDSDATVPNTPTDTTTQAQQQEKQQPVPMTPMTDYPVPMTPFSAQY